MVHYSGALLDSTFAALSDATRRGILARLARQGETSVSDLAAPYKMSLPAVSKHLRVLEHAGLVSRQKDGRVHRCRLRAGPMKDAAVWIEHYRQFWEAQLDSLARYLEDSATQDPSIKHGTHSTQQQRPKSRAASKPRAKKAASRDRIQRFELETP
jgi:DNA-binding transcriptional ArsR family regulator